MTKRQSSPDEIAAPKVEASPTPQKPAVEAVRAGGCERFQHLLEKYDWDVRTMLAIMRAESGCDPNVTGDTSLTFIQNGRTYGYSVSLFQVRILPGREHCDSHDPATNIACAYHVWKSQGYKAWSVYTSGKYLKYL
nr:MAG TPA: lysozyme [Caudoviricetes sp.]